MKILFCLMGILLLMSGVVEAQSMLEYSTLTTATTAAAVKAKGGKGQDQKGQQASSAENSGLVEGAMTNLYGETDQMLSSRSASLLGQVGLPQTAKEVPQPSAPVSESAPTPPPSEQPASSVSLYLNTGKTVQGKLVEQNEDYVKVDIEGVTTTYFREEISKVETN